MSDKLPISAHVLTWNSGKTLRQALTSIRHCAEILVIDGGSTDDTLAIAEEFGARVIAQPHPGKPIDDFAAVRNVGLTHASQPWILSLDSDEYASAELMRELSRIVIEESPCACAIPRRYVLDDGAIVRYATTYPNERLYFFHRDAVEQWIKPVHERPQLKPGTPVKRLKGVSLAPLGTLEEYKEKNRRYLAIEREKSKGKGWRFWFVHRLLRTLRSRAIATIKLLWIWLIPRPGKRLPLRHEVMRYWYAWRLIIDTMPTES